MAVQSLTWIGMEESKKERVITMLQVGVEPRLIRRVTSVSGAFVSQWRERLGLPKFRTQPPSRVDVNEAKRLRRTGVTLKEIGRRYGVTRQRVATLLRRRKRTS